MTDNVNVVLSVTEKGLASVQKDVEALRSELQNLGIDMSNIERRLGGIETATQGASRSIKNFSTASRESTRSTREEIAGLKERLRTIKQSSDAEYALNRARKVRERDNQFADFDKQFEDLSKLTGAQENFIAGRYALYDVASSYAAIGTALAGASIYAITVGAQFESAFTNVERTLETDTTAEQVDAIRNSLVQLSGQIPLTFAEISQIATLGNQLGLGADEVVGFTETVARFASVSGLSIDAVSNSFGGFLAQTGLSSQYLENLGSSIALVGINSNATEAQIVSLVREIAAGANGAGFAADEIVGLAGALASFQIAPERARGVLDTYFATLNRAVAEGGDRLELFANITGRTADELDKLVRGGEGATVFRDVLSGIQELNPDAAQLTQILDGLGLSGLRASNTFQRFLGNLGIADRAFEDAYKGFVEGSELNRQYSQTLDDLSSQFTIFINGLNALAAAASGGAVDSLAGLFTGINNVIFAIADFINENRLAANIIGIGVAVTGIIGGFLLFRSVLILATAATYAARTAIASVGATALASAGTIRGFAGALLGLSGAGGRAATAMTILRGALFRLLPLVAVVGTIGLLGSSLGGIENKAGNAALSLEQYRQATANSASSASGAADGADKLAESLGSGGVAAEAEEAAEKIRTLVDYVSDLTGVFRRSSDIRFGEQDAFDEITLAWIKITEEVAKYQSQIRSLTADRKLKEYFLGIAELYDDQIRAGELREDIAEIDEKLAEAQAGASTELEGNSKAAIENRKVFRDLLGSYEDYVSALSSAGASQEQIQAVISQLNGEFGEQATALGFNANEVANYQSRFQDLSTIIAQIPPVNVAFDGGPAEIALQEFFAKAAEQARTAGSAAGQGFDDGFGSGIGGGGGGGGFEDIFGPLYDGGINLAPDQGKGAGDLWLEKFLGQVGSGDFGGALETLGQGIEGASDVWVQQVNPEVEKFLLGIGSGFESFFGGLGNFFSDWFDGQITEIGQLLSNPLDFLPKWFNEQLAQLGLAAPEGGGRVAGAFKSGVDSTLNDGNDPLGRWINGQNNVAFQNGRAVGSNIGNGIAQGVSDALGGRQVRTPFKKEYSSGGFVDLGFSSGGYTGAGHWLQPAGLVHKGEYVIPKRHVDQATGLPSVEYVASLNRGKSAPKGGYATGGHVSGGITGPLELGPSTLGYLASALRVNLNVGQEQLARSVSNGDSRLAWQGSN